MFNKRIRYVSSGTIFPSEYFQEVSLEVALNDLKDEKELQLDTETSCLNPRNGFLRTLQLGKCSEDVQYIFDMSNITVDQLRPILDRKDILFIIQNAKFDLQWLYKEGVTLFKIWDTMISDQVLLLGKRYAKFELNNSEFYRFNLESIVERRAGITMDDSLGSTFTEDLDFLSSSQIIYAANDVRYLKKVKDEQERIAKENNCLRALQLENDYTRVLSYIEHCGIKLDPVKWKNKMENDLKEKIRLKKELDDFILENEDIYPEFVYQNLQGDLFSGFDEKVVTINWDSSIDCVTVFSRLGLNLEVKDDDTGGTKLSAGIPVISMQKDKHPIARTFIEYSRASKRVSSFGKNFLYNISPVTKRIHCNFNQLMDTSRLSCGGGDAEIPYDENGKRNKGVNIQQLPSDEETRGCFVPEDGYTMIDLDYSDQEGHVFAELSKDKAWIEFYNDTRKRDGHSFVAKMIFKDELKDVKEEEVGEKRKDLRQKSKGARFCFNYNGQPPAMAKNAGIPIKEAEEIFKGYFKAFSGIDAYFKRQKRDVWRRGYILINKNSGLRSYVEHFDMLKGVERRINAEGNDFWDAYRLAKLDDTVKHKLDYVLILELARKFSGGEPLNTIEGLYSYYNKSKYTKTYVSINEILIHVVRWFYKQKSAWETKSCNYPSQGTAAHMTKVAGIMYFNSLIERGLINKVYIPNCVHDEYVLEAPDEIAEQEGNLMSNLMEKSASIFCKEVNIKAEPEYAKHWVH